MIPKAFNWATPEMQPREKMTIFTPTPIPLENGIDQIEGGELDHRDLHLDLYHVHGPDSPFTSQLPLSFSVILSRDQARVRALNHRLSKSKHKKLRKSASGALLRPKLVSVPLNPGLSIGTGNYYVKIGLGSPATYYLMVVDTGSSFSWLQCQPCLSFCHSQVGQIFDPSASKTYKKLSCYATECSALKSATLNDPGCDSKKTCLYAASYGDSSFSIGYLSQDLLTISPRDTFPGFVYGCGQDNEGLFGRSAGLIGLAKNKLSLLSQVSKNYGYAFSYCLPSTGSFSGSLSIGKASLFSPALKFTPMMSDSLDPSLYFLRIAAITVAGKLLSVSPTAYKVSTIIDSGTVITRLPVPVYRALSQAFGKIMSAKHQTAPAYSILDTCYKGSVKTITSDVPTVQIMFPGGASLNLRPQNVLVDVDSDVTCLAFAGTSNVAIVGNHQQQGFKVAYDVTSSRIGIAPGGC
ncbi:Xylanase inhibitor, N-terminal [Dillenia turbinata]|uniref:Xylanase inhibitor, N-terminal n=1 Tax=Dillenia turbinata TaxID=194707 RepID=A0AAN8V5A0_9MAGN